jgi:hypothetical protein
LGAALCAIQIENLNQPFKLRVIQMELNSSEHLNALHNRVKSLSQSWRQKPGLFTAQCGELSFLHYLKADWRLFHLGKSFSR